MLEILDEQRSSQRYLPRSKSGCCDSSSSSDSKFLHIAEKSNSAKNILHQGAKLVILGDINTGKTSILVRLVKGHFIAYHEATIGASFLSKQLVVDNVPVKFEIWDTAGSERYYSLAPMYYRGALAAIVVYDITNEESFERALKWVVEVEQIQPKPIIALLGNKVDLEKSRVVKKETAQQYAKENNLLFSETSAKTGEGIIEIFVEISRQLISKAEQQGNIESETSIKLG